MRLASILAGAVLVLAGSNGPAALAQPAAAPPFAASAQIQALIAKARAGKPAGQTLFVQDIVGVAPFVADLEYRTGPAGGGTHEAEDELFYVVQGSGTFVTGGRLTPAPGPNPGNPAMANNTIEGGQSRAVAKGDLWIVPHNTPHMVSAVDGELVLISMHLPRPKP